METPSPDAPGPAAPGRPALTLTRSAGYGTPEAVRAAYAALDNLDQALSHEEVLARLTQLHHAATALRMDRAFLRELDAQVVDQTAVVAEAARARDADQPAPPGMAEVLLASLDETGKTSPSIPARRLYARKAQVVASYSLAVRDEDDAQAARLADLITTLTRILRGVEDGESAALAEAERYLRATLPPTA